MTCLFPKASSDCAEKSAIYSANRQEQASNTSLQGVRDTLRDQFCAEPEGTKSFTYRSDVYRVRINAEVADQSKKLEFVLQRRLPDELDSKIKYITPYKYLYWKML